MQLSKNINKIFWMVADKLTYVLYGIATVALLQVTDSKELGLFTLFNNLHNFILNVAALLGFNALLQFSANTNDIPLVNFYSLLNAGVVSIVFVLLLFILQTPISIIFNEPQLIGIISAIPLLVVLSIPRYFMTILLLRETAMLKLFVMNLVYFGTMSSMIFYNILCSNFLDNTDIININYIGSALSVFFGIFLTSKHLRFRLPKPASNQDNTTIKYKDIVKFLLKYSVANVVLIVPRLLDVYFVQLFFGTNVVGMYSPAKTIFRFIEDIINAVNSTIYSPIVQCCAKNDIAGINSIFSKVISILTLLFAGVTIVVLLFGDYLFSLFLPDKFVNALPIIKILMLISVVLPITLLQVVITASNLTTMLTKYVSIALFCWLMAYILIGNFFADSVQLVAMPYIIFMLIFVVQLWLFSRIHYQLTFKQLFRIIPDTYNFVQLKIKKYTHN